MRTQDDAGVSSYGIHIARFTAVDPQPTRAQNAQLCQLLLRPAAKILVGAS